MAPQWHHNVPNQHPEALAKAMYSYTPFLNDARRSAVAQAQEEGHPCLREARSFNGTYGWHQSLSTNVETTGQNGKHWEAMNSWKTH